MTIATAQSALTGANQFLLDVRDRAAYLDGHAPGAIHLDLKQWEQIAKTPEGELDRSEVWWPAIGALGIDGRKPVVVYDDGRMTDAARTWFILQWHGVDAHVLDGGWPSLLRTPSVTPDTVEHPAVAARYAAPEGYRPAVGLVTKEILKRQLDGSVQILDARTQAEHRGEDLRSNARGGHLPGAKLVEHASFLAEDGTLKSRQQLNDLLTDAGIVQDAPVVTHCDGGGRAALAAWAAVNAGQQEVSAYYLSFSDWAKDESCSIVRPES
ncbi:rhodanese-like domain-containing protein [Variovorax sp.]|uniref:sulfurtransferase n=1 Tax=Variovorax sp. TaxID=1871043 RepID=UPI000C36F8A1|nr:rhodanese-like domain-containing protein [Variovorax sp.]MBS82223.1 rhodanese family protein [Variovorax sp.]